MVVLGSFALSEHVLGMDGQGEGAVLELKFRQPKGKFVAEVSFQLKNPDFPLKNPDFLLKNPDVLLKNVDVTIKIK